MLNCVDYFFYFLYLWTPVVFFWFWILHKG
jgi:hypothetical protein